MKLRAPAVPLITIDPFFSVWSPADKLTDKDTAHWTNSGRMEWNNGNEDRYNVMKGVANIDGKDYRFMGADESVPALAQTALDIDAFSSTYTFTGAGIKLTAKFTSPVIPSDMYYLTRPVSYLFVKAESTDGKDHNVKVSVAVSEQICLNREGEGEVEVTSFDIVGRPTVRMGNKEQKILWRDGDDMRIDWGYFFLSVGDKNGKVSSFNDGKMTFVCAEADIADGVLFTFAYDDIKSIKYFGKELPSYWNRNGEKIESEIAKAFGDYETVLERCDLFSDRLFADAVKAGGEKYAEILLLSLRQAVAAHKVAVRDDGEIVYISKECFSNGCAATVDVSYPSIPMFLLYNPELIRGMMRPIYEFAATDMWKYDFAPHDAGTYPIIDYQRYGYNAEPDENGNHLSFEMQMPVEECGNMIVMEAATAIASGDFSFPAKHLDVLDSWVKYLIEYGKDPENQLCTDDFAGHLAHNCNLSLKAIMGIASYGIILKNLDRADEGEKYIQKAREYALDWTKRAANEDGSFRLAFDRENSFSMKYNIVWDKLFGTEIMPKNTFACEINRYKKELNVFGLPLDTRRNYTKSDWTIWAATLADNREDFEELIAPLWLFYNSTTDRVAMTDWYNTDTTTMVAFQHRSVVGGHFMKLLEYKGIMKV